MASATVSVVDRQIHRVRRRLFTQQLLTYLIWSWVVALSASALWFLLQPLVIQDAAVWLRWTVLGSCLGTATLVSIVVAILRAPSAVTAALSLDERFQLRERVTTTLTLDAVQANSPAGQALLADVTRRLDPVRVGDRFPVQVPWSAWLVPAFAAAIALLAIFYNPILQVANAGGGEPLTVSKEEKEAMEKKLSALKKKEPKPGDPKVKSQELAELEAKLDELARKPHDTKEETSELVAKMTELEDKIKKQQQDMNDKAEARKEAMKQMDRLMKRQQKEGPANDLRKALDQNDMKKAEQELDRLSQRLKAEEQAEKLKKKLQDENLSKEEREKTQKDLDKLKDQKMSQEEKDKLDNQLQDMKDKLERLARKQEEKEEELKEKREKGEIDDEQLKRELEQLEKSKLSDKDMQDLKKMADKLAECQKCMKEGKNAEAGQKLEDLADQLEALDKESDGDCKALKKKLQELQEAKKCMCESLDGNNAAQGQGPRPITEDDNTGHKNERVRSDLDNSKVTVVDLVPGKGMKSPKSQEELREDIKKASQEAPEAIDRMRLPKSAGDMTRGYFDKLRGADKTPEKK